METADNFELDYVQGGSPSRFTDGEIVAIAVATLAGGTLVGAGCTVLAYYY